MLTLNGSTNLPVTANGAFTFPGALASGTTYAVTVGTQPSNPTQACTVTNGSGTIGAANVTDVAVSLRHLDVIRRRYGQRPGRQRPGPDVERLRRT